MATAANGVVGGVADLGSIAAYPIYCFPNYGSCPVHWFETEHHQLTMRTA